MNRVITFLVFVGIIAGFGVVGVSASGGIRIESVAEVSVNSSQDLITIEYTDNQSESGYLYLKKGMEGRWSVSYSPVVLEGLAPVAELSGDIRQKYTRALADYCDRAKKLGGRDRERVYPLISVLLEIEKQS